MRGFNVLREMMSEGGHFKLHLKKGKVKTLPSNSVFGQTGGNLGYIPINSTYKKASFGLGFISVPLCATLKKWVPKCHFLVVKSTCLARSTSNYPGSRPILRHF